MGKISREIRNEFAKCRPAKVIDKLCFAPFNNMYLKSTGAIDPCWLANLNNQIQDKTLKEIWFGDRFSHLRESIHNNELPRSCRVCEANLNCGNYEGALAKAYDLDIPPGEYPQIMEFELSNKCNLECLMCNGRLSTGIRKNREKLPVVHSHYDENFIEQMIDFIPHLKEARFNGGEPFLQERCWELWEKIVTINPSVEITVATNGQVLNQRIKDIMSRGHFRINVSIDSLEKSLYEKIRVNGNFEKLMENFEFFKSYCRQKGTNLSVMFNPMRINWWEAPNFIEFTQTHEVSLWFNTIHRPAKLALWNLPPQELSSIYTKLNEYEFTMPLNSYRNGHIFVNFVQNQVKIWQDRQLELEKDGTLAARELHKDVAETEFLESFQKWCQSKAQSNHYEIGQRRLQNLNKYLQALIDVREFYSEALKHRREESFNRLIYDSDADLKVFALEIAHYY